MNGVLKYLSFKGRANRQRYWLTVLLLLGLIFVSAVVAKELTAVPLLVLLGIPVWVALLVAVFANATRRLHDRAKSAWWLLLFYGVPTVLNIPLELTPEAAPDEAQAFAVLLTAVGLPFSIWGLVEMGFLSGMLGPNRFGDDPLGRLPQEPAVA
jgi:uncharacterized membrane protein YhaH (DUF805 family)